MTKSNVGIRTSYYLYAHGTQGQSYQLQHGWTPFSLRNISLLR